MDRDEAYKVIIKYAFSGIMGPSSKGMGASCALMNATDDTFTYSASLEHDDDTSSSVDRYQIEVDRRTGICSTPKKIQINDEDMRSAILAATGETVATSNTFTDGGFSISYKVTTIERPETAYVVQLRHHAKVASMDAVMKAVSANSQPGVIPMPAIYSIPGEAEHQRLCGMGRQIAEFVPGVMAEGAYFNMPHADKLKFVRKMALAWQACWDLPLPSPPQIGELLGTDEGGKISLAVGPDRHYALGGPFTSVREWLKSRIRCSISSLERAEGIDDFKDEFLSPLNAFADKHLDRMPQSVEECPVVFVHVDMGLHNVLVSADDHTNIKAIIDWEFCASAPFLAAYEVLDMLFRPGSPSGFGPEFMQADELRKAFWDTIPRWKSQWESRGVQDFIEWFRFTLFIQPRYCPKDENPLEFWAENRRVIETMLEKYGGEKD